MQKRKYFCLCLSDPLSNAALFYFQQQSFIPLCGPRIQQLRRGLSSPHLFDVCCLLQKFKTKAECKFSAQDQGTAMPPLRQSSPMDKKPGQDLLPSPYTDSVTLENVASCIVHTDSTFRPLQSSLYLNCKIMQMIHPELHQAHTINNFKL